jgi:Sugar efflux transporter for intercellular exchange
VGFHGDAQKHYLSVFGSIQVDCSQIWLGRAGCWEQALNSCFHQPSGIRLGFDAFLWSVFLPGKWYPATFLLLALDNHAPCHQVRAGCVCLSVCQANSQGCCCELSGETAISKFRLSSQRRQRDSASLHWPLAGMTVVNGLLWVFYGLAIGDAFIWVPNGIGAVLGAVQLVLIRIYPMCASYFSRLSHQGFAGLMLRQAPECLRPSVKLLSAFVCCSRAKAPSAANGRRRLARAQSSLDRDTVHLLVNDFATRLVQNVDASANLVSCEAVRRSELHIPWALLAYLSLPKQLRLTMWTELLGTGAIWPLADLVELQLFG